MILSASVGIQFSAYEGVRRVLLRRRSFGMRLRAALTR